MSNITLQELLLVLTFVLTGANILSSYTTQRAKRMQQEPAITDIQKKMIETHSEIKQMRIMIESLSNSWNAVNRRVDEQAAFINEMNIRMTKIEEALKTLRKT